MCIVQQGLSLIGAAVVACAAFSLLSFFFAKFIRGGKDLKRAYGSWAIVTGATGKILRRVEAVWVEKIKVVMNLTDGCPCLFGWLCCRV